MQNQPTRWAKFLRDNQPVHSFLRADEETMITECLEDTISITGGAERSGTLGWRNSHRAARLEVATWHTSEVSSSRRELRGLGRSEHISLRSMYPVLDRLSEAVASSRRLVIESSIIHHSSFIINQHYYGKERNLEICRSDTSGNP